MENPDSPNQEVKRMIVSRKKLDAMAQCLQDADSLLRQIYRDEAIRKYKEEKRKK